MNAVTIMSLRISKQFARLGPLAVLLFSLLATEHAIAASGGVYFIIGSDTAIWNDGSTVDVYTRHPHYPQSFFTTPGSPAFQVMDAAWRAQYADSFGQPIKFTWWMMGGNIYRDADNVNVPTANSMVLHLMKQYQGEAMKTFGDEISLHYHTFYWSDYNLDGHYYWNQSRTFDECREDFDFTLAQYLLDEGVYPVTFRSGWHFMDNTWQQYLDQLLPFSLHNNWPVYRAWYTNEPINNVQDWTQATSSFTPFHPSPKNYQLPGNGRGWELRSTKMQNLTQAQINTAFANASNGLDQVVCIWNHLPESFVYYTDRTASLIHTASTNYPGVAFRYCTAVEGMQRALGITDTTPPVLDVTETAANDRLTLAIYSSKGLFQPAPFVACRNAFQQYSNITALCISNAPNQWTVTVPMPRSELSRVGIAAVDANGNCATVIRRYLPDDIYIDTKGMEYSEISGNWSNTPNAAWGTNARLATLTVPAAARWSLPVTQSGLYALAAQVPEITNAAGNVTFDILSNNVSIHSISFSAGLPPARWTPLGVVPLDSTASNAVVVTVPASNPANVFAANVLRLLPLPGTSVPAPLITRQPENRTNLVGSTVNFEVEFFSFEDAHCQWYNRGGLLRDQTNSTLVVSNATLDLAGGYYAAIANGSGAATSAVARLTMNRPPTGAAHGFATRINQSVVVSMSDLLETASDPDGDPILVGAWGYSDYFGTLSQNASQIIYTSALNFTGVDTFTYWLSDGRGGTLGLRSQVFVTDGPLPLSGHLAPFQSTNGLTLRFCGASGQTCKLQRSTDLRTWATIDTQVVPGFGIVDFLDVEPPKTAAFYRILAP